MTIKEGDWIIVDDYNRKKCFGVTERGNYLMKMYLMNSRNGKLRAGNSGSY